MEERRGEWLVLHQGLEGFAWRTLPKNDRFRSHRGLWRLWYMCFNTPESIDTATLTGCAMWHMVGILAGLERSLMQERAKAGRAAAQARGIALRRIARHTTHRGAYPQEAGPEFRSV